MKTYIGRRRGTTLLVTVDGEPLNPRLDLCNHSPTGFEWGYHGSGPAQLALALLADHLDDEMDAFNLHQRFKWALVAELPKKHWRLTSLDIETAIQGIRAKEIKAGRHQ